MSNYVTLISFCDLISGAFFLVYISEGITVKGILDTTFETG